MRRLLSRRARIRALEEENRELKERYESLVRECESQKKLIDTLGQIRNVLGEYIHDLKDGTERTAE
jgi:cell division protein FtsB